MAPPRFLLALLLLLPFAALAGDSAPEQSPEQVPLALPATRTSSVLDNINFWGYGEIEYARPTRDLDRTVADLRRAVVGIGYRFSPAVSFNSEWEVEHSVASASDDGEFEVEQFYLEFQPTDWMTITAGLFLMPFGLINEHHEPTQYFGVQRNFVETLILPSTWREGGIGLHGTTPLGIGWSLGVTTGNSFSSWNFAPTYPLYANAFDLEAHEMAPLQASHQELQSASAKRLSGYIAADYHGYPGLVVGGAIKTGRAVKPSSIATAPGADDPLVTLWEAHVRYTPGRLDLSALYTAGYISNTAAANAANPGAGNPIPASFNGYFLQAAYSVWQNGMFRLAPFVRGESYDMGARYKGTTGPVTPTGLVPASNTPGDNVLWPQQSDKVLTIGANFFITPQVVMKCDYQWFANNTTFDRLDLGIGMAF